MKMRRILTFSCVFLVLLACKKDKENPYETYFKQPPVTINPADTIDPNSFVGIHNNILKPTCANNGCHDGSFEPDYRTIESAYSTLVMQPINKNDLAETYKYRVIPGDAENSMLYVRITKDLESLSGQMPLAVDPNSDWNSKKNQYINNVKNWINNGAKDEFGNDPVTLDNNPVFSGVLGKVGSAIIGRGGAGQGTLKVPYQTTTFDVFFSFKDDNTTSPNLTYLKAKISNNPIDFKTKPEIALQKITPTFNGEGYFGTSTNYTHKITLNIMDYPLGITQYFRVYVKDTHSTPTEIPSDGSADYIKSYFSFTRQ